MDTKEFEIVILFGGGDAGGIIITKHGVKKIPPWNPDILFEIRSLGALTWACRAVEDKPDAPLFRTALEALTKDVTTKIWQAAGVRTEGAGRGFLFYDDEVPFCLTYPHPPRPIPFPHLSSDLRETLAASPMGALQGGISQVQAH